MLRLYLAFVSRLAGKEKLRATRYWDTVCKDSGNNLCVSRICYVCGHWLVTLDQWRFRYYKGRMLIIYNIHQQLKQERWKLLFGNTTLMVIKKMPRSESIFGLCGPLHDYCIPSAYANLINNNYLINCACILMCLVYSKYALVFQQWSSYTQNRNDPYFSG